MEKLIFINMLEVKQIKKSFGGVHAIKGSNFTIEEKKITALIGPNGAGKTTLFDIITGFTKPDTGEIIFNGVDVSDQYPFVRANNGMSRTFQQVRLFHYLTILDHLILSENNDDTHLLKNMIKTATVDRSKYKKILEEYGIEHGLDTQVSDLSYGQRKLLQIAMAVTKPHTLLLLDEPVAGVNTVVQDRIEQLLLDLKKRGETILIIDHDMNFIRKLADQVIVLDAGIVLLEGSPQKVLEDPRVLEAYLGE